MVSQDMLNLSQKLAVRRSTLAAEVARKLSDHIQDGSFPPGTRLVETELASVLGVSRGPLREALRILESNSLVETIPGRGSYVAPISRVDAQEIYWLRNILEAEAVRLACRKATAEQIEVLGKILDDLLAAARESNFKRVAELETSFHSHIWEMAGHKRLKQILTGMIPQIRRYMSLQTHLFDYLIVGVTDHQVIFAEISKRNTEAAVKAMHNHLTAAGEAAVKKLPVEKT